MTEHYLDNSATTKVSDAAAQKAMTLMCTTYGNPSSLHSLGFEASKELEAARGTIAEKLGADPTEIYFTSGGTEANNLAIFGAVEAMKRRGKRIITTAFEHSSVHESMLELKKQGYDVVFISPDKEGVISAADVINAITDDTILVSVMYINNEVGSISPIGEIANFIKRRGLSTLIHTDAVQAFGKVNIRLSGLPVHLMSISAHKIHGPKGVGALYTRKGCRVLPRTFGGKQENKLRPGTEALPLIGAFSVAVSELDITASHTRVSQLSEYLKNELSTLSDDIVINSPCDCLPYILNFSVKGIRSETMLHHLASKGVFVSSGSACSKGGKSHVLTAMGLENDIIDSAIRVSFSKHSTTQDVDALVSGIKDGLATLAKR